MGRWRVFESLEEALMSGKRHLRDGTSRRSSTFGLDGQLCPSQRGQGLVLERRARPRICRVPHAGVSHFLGIDDPKDSLNKRVHVTGVYIGPERGNRSGSTILLTDDAHVEEGQCP